MITLEISTDEISTYDYCGNLMITLAITAWKIGFGCGLIIPMMMKGKFFQNHSKKQQSFKSNVSFKKMPSPLRPEICLSSQF